MEVEYVVACKTTKEAVWLQNFLLGLGVVLLVVLPLVLFCDNSGAMT